MGAPLQESRQYFKNQQLPVFLISHAFNKFLSSTYCVPGVGGGQHMQRPRGRKSLEHWRASLKEQRGWRVVSKGEQV